METDNATSCNLLALQCSTFPYTFSQMVYDNNNKPIDFFILDTNEAFAKLLDLKREDVIDHNASDFFPDLQMTDNHGLRHTPGSRKAVSPKSMKTIRRR